MLCSECAVAQTHPSIRLSHKTFCYIQRLQEVHLISEGSDQTSDVQVQSVHADLTLHTNFIWQIKRDLPKLKFDVNFVSPYLPRITWVNEDDHVTEFRLLEHMWNQFMELGNPQNAIKGRAQNPGWACDSW